MDKIQRININMSLECAVTVIDDFSDKVIKSSQISVVSDTIPVKKAIAKNDGFFLFLKNEHTLKRIKISGSVYSTQFIDVDTSILDALNPTIKIYAKPNRAYPFPKDTTIVVGKAKAEESISLVCKTLIPSLTLLKDYTDTKSNEIMLFATDKNEIVGKRYASFGKGAKISEIFEIDKKADGKGIYYLKNPLEAKLTKSASKIYRIYSTVADQNGDYIIPIKSEIEEECTCIISIDGKKWTEYEIVKSKHNIIDLI